MATYINTVDGKLQVEIEPNNPQTYLPNIGQGVKSELNEIKEALDNKASAIFDTASGDIVTITDGADDVPMKSLVCNIDPVQGGSGEPSPENVRPISGHTGVDVYASGRNIHITFPSEAGTVYGGYVDVVKGKLVVDRKIANLGDRNWTLKKNTNSCQAWAADFSDIKSPTNANTPYDAISSAFKGVSFNTYYTSSTPGVFAPITASRATSAAFCVESGKYENATEFKAAVDGLQFCYKLATVTEYDLDPVTVKTLLGINNVWNSTGDTTIEYPCDTKLYIERLTQPTEDDMVANANIASGKYFMVGNDLYLSTTTIPAGDTINPGTNCTRVSLADALNAINS